MNENIAQIINRVHYVLDRYAIDDNYFEVIRLLSDDREITWENRILNGRPEEHKTLREANYSIKDIIKALINEFGKDSIIAGHDSSNGSYEVGIWVDAARVIANSNDIKNPDEEKWVINLAHRILEYNGSLYPEYDEQTEEIVEKLFQDEASKSK